MTASDNKKVVLSFFEAGARGDMESCFALISNDVVWTNIGTTRFSGTFVGKQELMERLLGPLFGQLKNGISSTLENIMAEGNFVVAQTRGSGETLDGKPYNNSYCQVFKVDDGLIVEVKEYMDTELITSVFGPS